ncbi:protein zer-1 homolog isoform X1 [Saccostrea echinata]|uniref:protein zer-1 homolog isoform X1 n=1 Tax=Saccostrea echinata TaxID=191078 RepID=UPI002A82F5E7|nr:protein zer-1 homolog isoform X1 [Saccostrea echinata]
MPCSWPENNPESLEDLCMKVAVKNIHSFAEKLHSGYRLKEGISLQHPSLCDKLFQSMYEEYPNDLAWLSIFKDTSFTRLNRVDLSWRSLEADSLNFACGHPVRELNLSHCNLDEGHVRIINKLGGTLLSLIIGDAFELIKNLIGKVDLMDCDLAPKLDGKDENKFGLDYIFKCPNLRKLVIRDALFEDSDDQNDPSSGHSVLAAILCPLKNLTYLDLSSCVIDLEFMDCLEELENLLSLDLSCISIENLQEALKNICKAKKLRHLDLSGTEENPCYHNNPEQCVKYMVENLPHLTSLDISGTNLASFKMQAEKRDCCIPGLEGKQLEFLGLLDCPDSPCERADIPAKRVTGSHTEAQILLALRLYKDKEHLLTSALNHLFQMLRYEEVHDQCQALESTVAGMKHNWKNKQVQISGSAALFYILKGVNREKVTQLQRRRVIWILLDAMEEHRLDKTVLRNVLLNFCSMNLPENMTFCHRRMTKNLMEVVASETQEEFIQRLGIILLNCIACQVDGEEKLTFGELGAIEAMLKIIKRKLALEQCDENMEVAWSMMWNITDETAENCRRFIDNDGLELFKRCLKKFPNNEELLRNMMGLMGNIAEVKELRKQLMRGDFLIMFCELMESEKDGIEVSYNAVGIFSHITADGNEAWTVILPTRAQVMMRMIKAIERWPLDSKRNINYRSFGPILNLLKTSTPAAQYWAVWALCNLTRVYPERYCRLLKSEGGLELLETLEANPRVLLEVQKLARTVIEQVLAGLQKKNSPQEQHQIDESSDD